MRRSCFPTMLAIGMVACSGDENHEYLKGLEGQPPEYVLAVWDSKENPPPERLIQAFAQAISDLRDYCPDGNPTTEADITREMLEQEQVATSYQAIMNQASVIARQPQEAWVDCDAIFFWAYEALEGGG